MNWIPLTEPELLETIKSNSQAIPQVIFKHSTSCSISGMAKSRLERGEVPANVDFYLLDLLKFKNISGAIAEKFQVHHESPQVLVIKKGECVYDESHYAINLDEIVEQTAL